MNLLKRTLQGLGRVAGAGCRGIQTRRILRSDDTFSVRACRSTEAEVECRKGTLWITQEGCSDDILLKAGQRIRLRGRGRILIQALTAATLLMTNLRELKTV